MSDSQTRPSAPAASAARVLLHVTAVATLTGLVIGAVDGGYAAEASGTDRMTSLLAAAGTVGTVAALVGGLEGSLLALVFRFAERLGIRERWLSVFERDDVVVNLHAEAVAFLVACSAAIPPLYFVIRAGDAIQEDAMRFTLLTAAGALCVACALVVRAVVRVALERSFRWLHRRFRLPRPHSPKARYVVYVALPATALAVPLVWAYGELLGPLLWVCSAALFLVWQGLAFVLIRLVGARIPHVARIAASGALLTLALAGAGVANTWTRTSDLAASAPIMEFSVRVLQQATDVDRDGFSALFQGRDCAPWDPGRSPGTREIPSNGIDEDCDGSDLEVRASVRITPFYGDLEKDRAQRFNVLWIVVDSMRPDHMSLYGYEKATTPFMEKLGKESWVFERAFAQSTATSLSMPSMFSGAHPGSIEWVKQRYYPGPKTPFANLPGVLGEHGYETTIVVSHRMSARMPGVLLGYEHVLSAPNHVSWRSDDHIVAHGMRSIYAATRAKKPFLVTLWFDGVHVPYKGGTDRALPAFEHEDEKVVLYDRAIAATDHHIEAILAQLQNLQLTDDTIVIVTADHGEEFYEHGSDTHGHNCHTETARVPLVMRVPGFEPERVDTKVAMVDVVPTLLELLDAPRDALELDGQSLLVPVLTPERAEPERPIYCYMFRLFKRRRDFFIESVRAGNLHLQRDLVSSNIQLYDIDEDPEEQKNLADETKYASRREALERLLSDARRGNILELPR